MLTCSCFWVWVD